MPKVLAATLVLLALTAPVTLAQQPFEAVVSGYDAICGTITAPDVPVIQWFTPDRTDFGLLDPFAVASGDGLRVLGLASFIPGLRIVRLEPDGTETPFFASNLYRPYSIAQASNGRVFVGAAEGPAPVLLVISSTGVLETVYSVLRIAMDDGRELSRRPLTASLVTGLIIGAAGAVAVPTATDLGLMLIGMMIAGVGVFVLRGRS